MREKGKERNTEGEGGCRILLEGRKTGRRMRERKKEIETETD